MRPSGPLAEKNRFMHCRTAVPRYAASWQRIQKVKKNGTALAFIGFKTVPNRLVIAHKNSKLVS
jgi:hypothetical protein